MESISFKAPPGTKKALLRIAKQRGETPSRIAWLAVQKELMNAQRGRLLGAGKHLISSSSSYDPEEPAFSTDDWETAP